MKTKLHFLILALFPIALLNADEVQINNLTPESIAQNPSEIYSISADIYSKSSNVDKDSIKPSIVIDGKTFPMTKGTMGPNSFTYDYKMPSGANTVRYYFDANYITKIFGTTKERQVKSNVHELHLVNRYASTLDVSRGPIGASITVSGRGLSNTDTILFGDTEAQTTYISPNLISFKVPTLRANKIYDVYIQGSNGSLHLGEFRIDASTISSNRDSIALKTNERATFTLEIDNPAPKGGIDLDITTDVLDSIIMDEVSFPQGSRTVNVTIEGGEPSSSTLFINADGFNELTIPITVTEDENNFWSA